MSPHRPGPEPHAASAASPDGDLARDIEEATRRLELADPDAGLGWIDRLVNRVAEVIGVAIFAVITALIFVNAILRYTTDASLVYAEEVVIGLTPWLAVTGVFLAVRRQTMIRIDFFYERFPVVLQGPIALLGQIWSAAVFAYVAWISFRYVAFFGADPTPVLEVPKGIFAVALVIGPVAAALALLAGVLRELRARREVAASADFKRGKGP